MAVYSKVNSTEFKDDLFCRTIALSILLLRLEKIIKSRHVFISALKKLLTRESLEYMTTCMTWEKAGFSGCQKIFSNAW